MPIPTMAKLVAACAAERATRAATADVTAALLPVKMDTTSPSVRNQSSRVGNGGNVPLGANVSGEVLGAGCTAVLLPTLGQASPFSLVGVSAQGGDSGISSCLVSLRTGATDRGAARTWPGGVIWAAVVQCALISTRGRGKNAGMC